ncbi:hypothetical protein, partial [Thomasclavelia cocleata]
IITLLSLFSSINFYSSVLRRNYIFNTSNLCCWFKIYFDLVLFVIDLAIIILINELVNSIDDFLYFNMLI